MGKGSLPKRCSSYELVHFNIVNMTDDMLSAKESLKEVLTHMY